MPAKKTSELVRLKPADSFDLIHLIARSQADPRKAVAELVQNSLDAGARNVRVEWFSVGRQRALRVRDDGRGVFPDMERSEALRRIATTIGHSHKAHLSPAERHRQMTLGKYGIGLLGFWSVGRHMEIKTRVGGSEAWTLRLEEEGRDGEVAAARKARLPLDETFTEVTITDIHPAAAPQIKPRRLAAYLAGEMRGQLLARDVRLEIHDHVGRGRTAKRLLVKPQRYQGILVEGLAELAVPGHASARVELYLVPESEGRVGHVQLACGGATVLDDMAHVEGMDEAREPWSLGRFEGVVDFPDLAVAPSTRRGFVPNEAARAFLEALPELEARCREVLAEDAERRRQEREADDARDLRRLFRPISRMLPQYVLFDVKDGARAGGEDALEGGEEIPDQEPAATPVDETPEAEPPVAYLFPPGPLASVDLKPRRSFLSLEGTRKLKAAARDENRRVLTEDVAYEWSLEGVGTLESSGATATYKATLDPGRCRVRVVALQGGLRAEATADVVVSENIEPEDGSKGGIPDPEPVQAPAEPWRSRLVPGKWQYNSGHADYRLVQDDQKRRLRYLAHLFAKELVLHNFGEPGDSEVLERMVEVLTRIGDAVTRRSTSKRDDDGA